KARTLIVRGGISARRSRCRAFHALRLEYGRGHRSGERLDQSLGGCNIARAGAEASRIGRVVLDLGRQRSDQGDALHWQDLADLVDAELGLAADDEVGDRAALLELGLWLHRTGDSELLEQAREINAARP